jgi:hypothetical protein
LILSVNWPAGRATFPPSGFDKKPGRVSRVLLLYHATLSGHAVGVKLVWGSKKPPPIICLHCRIVPKDMWEYDVSSKGEEKREEKRTQTGLASATQESAQSVVASWVGRAGGA